MDTLYKVSRGDIIKELIIEGYCSSNARELLDAWLDYHGTLPDSGIELLDSVYGHFESVEDFAREYVELGCYNIDPNISDYVDWNRFGNDLLGQHYYMADNGWVIIL